MPFCFPPLYLSGTARVWAGFETAKAARKAATAGGEAWRAGRACLHSTGSSFLPLVGALAPWSGLPRLHSDGTSSQLDSSDVDGRRRSTTLSVAPPRLRRWLLGLRLCGSLARWTHMAAGPTRTSLLLTGSLTRRLLISLLAEFTGSGQFEDRSITCITGFSLQGCIPHCVYITSR